MKTLYLKFASTTIAIMIFSSVFAFILSNLYYQQYLKPMNDEKTTVLAKEITHYVEQNPHIELSDYLQHTASLGYHLLLIDEDFQKTSFQQPFRETKLAQKDVEAVLNGEIYHGILQFPHKTFMTGFFANEAENSIGVPLQINGQRYALFIHPNIKLLFNEMHFLLAALLVLTIFLSIIFVLIFTKYMVQPITKLTAATKSIVAGNYRVKLNSKRRDELGDLALSFKTMAQKLEQVDLRRKEFTTNISHDIQSPLSNIKGYLSLLEKNDLSPETEAQYRHTIHEEIARLSQLTNQLLLLNSLDYDQKTILHDSFSMDEQLQKIINYYQWQIQQKDIMLSYSLPPSTITADAKLLNMVWDNLLSNAIKYNKPFGMINIELTEQKNTFTIVFQDSGIGMQPQEQQRIFDRFYRADSPRTRTIEGTGLGLSIVWHIIQLHHGQIEVDSIYGERTTMTIILPKSS